MPPANRTGRADFALRIAATEQHAEAANLATARGLTPNEFARVIRKSPDWVRAEIAAGRLGALNLSNARCGRPKYIILPHHVEAFEKARSAAPPPNPPKRRQKRASETDFFPND